ncbi:hypothetical protein J1605_015557 [Eschrichtius robustus]|uniref:Serpin domain-containing protein n=1 Tax=Eschrichtius robustus TaxID=9764 RepID=A0AB34G9T8_ESCRO|nr:hypothetical protein J1605_015557 [Eschrichtius robustus]
MLGAMEMVDTFTDFSGIMVSKILHKFYVEVTEESIEAAAATGVETVLASLPIYEHFYCDYPFSLSSTVKPTASSSLAELLSLRCY